METKNVILHITTRGLWQEALDAGIYRADSLATEGFIHCSLPEQVVFVADSRFRGQTGLILLCIDTGRVEPDIRYEGEVDQYPHIYGPLNTDAVVDILDFPPNNDGSFALPVVLLNRPAM